MSIYVMPTIPVTNNITALAGGAAAGATPLTSGFNEVNTVITTGDSVVLPISEPGKDVLVNVQNTAAGLSVKIYGQANVRNGGIVDSIIAHGVVAVTPGLTGVSVVNGHVTEFVCTTLGQWKQLYDNA